MHPGNFLSKHPGGLLYHLPFLAPVPLEREVSSRNQLLTLKSHMLQADRRHIIRVRATVIVLIFVPLEIIKIELRKVETDCSLRFVGQSL